MWGTYDMAGAQLTLTTLFGTVRPPRVDTLNNALAAHSKEIGEAMRKTLLRDRMMGFYSASGIELRPTKARDGFLRLENMPPLGASFPTENLE